MTEANKYQAAFKGFISLCTLLTLIIVILDYFGFGKEFWKSKNPAKRYSESEYAKKRTLKKIETAIKAMELENEEKEFFIKAEKALMKLQFHVNENTTFALNNLKPEERYYSDEYKVLFYTSHELKNDKYTKCKKVTVEWPEVFSMLRPLGTKLYCLVEGEWQEVSSD